MTAVLDALDLARVDVLGQSWSGVLALEFSLRFPDRVRTLIAADTAFEVPRMERGFEAWRCFPRCSAPIAFSAAAHCATGTGWTNWRR